MKLEEWDREIGGRLDDITYCSRWLLHYADRIERNVRDLPAKPEFQTMALAEINRAIEEIEGSLKTLKFSQREYMEKKVAR